MAKFKVGDTVKKIYSEPGYINKAEINDIGVIIEVLELDMVLCIRYFKGFRQNELYNEVIVIREDTKCGS